MTLDNTHPAIDDVARRAKRRLPHFVWEFVDSAAGDESTKRRSRTALDAVRLLPQVLRGLPAPELTTTLLGREQALPFGIAPVGMSGLIWPDAELMLARLAVTERIPYGLSTVAAMTPEEVGPSAGDEGWFQLYPPGDAEIRRDLLKRAKAAGFRVLVLTADVPVASRRERQRRAQLTTPVKLTPRLLLDSALHPAWALRRLRRGIPDLKTLDPYAPETEGNLPSTAHVGYLLRAAPDWDYLAAVREEWDGPLVVKGVLDPEAAARISKVADCVWVSAHGGRQFEASPAPAEMLPAIRQAVGPDFPLIADGGVKSAADILRYIALGADFVMLGRAFQLGVAAFGEAGAAHVVHILREGLKADMGQLGISRPNEVRRLLQFSGIPGG